MSDDLQVSPEADQIDAPQPACCPWRTAMQVPLLLCAAAGLGFAGQQAWQNRTDIQSLWPQSSQCSQIYAAGSGCTSGGAQSQGCGARSLTASCGQAAASDCGSSATAVAEADETVSALLPENLVDEF